jgi:hypothetical protein
MNAFQIVSQGKFVMGVYDNALMKLRRYFVKVFRHLLGGKAGFAKVISFKTVLKQLCGNGGLPG